MSRKFLIVMAALIGASLFFIGCETEVEVPGPSNLIHIDAVVPNESALATALLTDAKVIEVTGAVTNLGGSVPTIPEGRTVIFINTVATTGADVSIEGTVYVGSTGVLTVGTASNTKFSVKGKGVLNVGYAGGGTLALTAATDLADGDTPAETALDTAAARKGKVVINSGTLAYGGTVFNDAVALLDAVAKGTVTAASVTGAGAPSAIVTAVENKVSADKWFDVKSSADETLTELEIPAGLSLTTVAATMMTAKPTTLVVNGSLTGVTETTLAAVDTLTVNGSLTGSGLTLLARTESDNVTGSGSLVASGNVATTNAVAILESALESASLGTTTLTGAIAIPGGVYRELTGIAAPDDNVSVGAGSTLSVGTSLTLAHATTKALTLASGAKLTGVGKVVAGNTEIVGSTGGWQVVGTGSVEIKALAAATASITASVNTAVLTAGTGATIAQTKGASNNLTIAADTTIDLKGTIATGTSVGAISLEEDVTTNQGGKLTFAAGTSIVKIGSETNAAAALGADSGVFVTTEATNKITVSGYADVLIYPGATTAGKANTIKGGAAPGSLQANASTGSGSVTINAGTATS
jgi:Ni,Fe-hydrogenase III small subunit